MKFPYEIMSSTFVIRNNRFTAEILVGDEAVTAHVPNTGRLKELLYPGAQIGVSHHPSVTRKTAYEVRIAKKQDTWYSVDSQIANALAEEVLNSGQLQEFGDFKELKREVTLGDSRLDIRLQHEDLTHTYIEVKGVTLEVDGQGRFPDAPTVRGVKHLKLLEKLALDGVKCGVLLICQSDAIHSFTPNEATDPEFCKALRACHEAGVKIVAAAFSVSTTSIDYVGVVPVTL